MIIVVGYVPKPEGRAALDRAIEEAKLRGGRLVVINASRGDTYVDAGYAAGAGDRAGQEPADRGGRGPEFRQLVRGHEPSEEVVELAEELGAELIVIGMRHRTAVGKFLIGSTAQRILLDAPCPVLAVKADGRSGRGHANGAHGARPGAE